MSFDERSTERLRRLGVTSAEGWRWWERLLEEGHEFFELFLAGEERKAADFRERLPELTAFAAECRRTMPVPKVEEFTPREKAEYEILRDEMAQFADRDLPDFARNRNYALIVETTRLGLAAASDVFADCPLPTVILPQEEERRWYSSLPEGTEPYCWYLIGLWTLHEGLESRPTLNRPFDLASWVRERYPIRDGEEYWLVNSGHYWGCLAGGQDCDLWIWNGTKASYCGPLYHCQS